MSDQANMMECPRCKEDMPLLSKICPVCGYVKESDETSLSAEDFADNLEACLRDIKSIPEPTFLKSMEQLTFIMFPIIAIYLLIIALISQAGLFWILFAVFLILSIIYIRKKSRGSLGNDPFNQEFKEIKSDYEYNERLAKRNFGKNKEVATLLTEISSEISSIESHRKSVAGKNLLIWIIILFVFFLLASGGVFSINKSLNTKEESSIVDDSNTRNQNQAVQKGDLIQVIENFQKTANTDNQARLNVLSLALSQNESQIAEDFFFNYCMGEVGDLACAETIVKYYTGKNDISSAENFIEKCTKLRYKSDLKKLKKLINQ